MEIEFEKNGIVRIEMKIEIENIEIVDGYESFDESKWIINNRESLLDEIAISYLLGDETRMIIDDEEYYAIIDYRVEMETIIE